MIIVSRIKQILNGLLDYIEYDTNNLPEGETFLYQMFYGLADGSYNFYEQARKIFVRTNQSPRKIRVSLEFPKDKTHFPCLVVREPERTHTRPEPFGGFGVPDEDVFGADGETEREGFRCPSTSKVEIMCMSTNVLESILICEVMFALLQGARNTFEQEFTVFDFSTSEIIAENPVFPEPILIKKLNITVEEDGRYASIIKPEIVKRFVIEAAIPVDKLDNPA